jgi:hypothetical protein
MKGKETRGEKDRGDVARKQAQIIHFAAHVDSASPLGLLRNHINACFARVKRTVASLHTLRESTGYAVVDSASLH